MKKIIILIMILFLQSVLFADKAPKYGEQESAVGRQNVEEIARTYKFVEDPYYVEKVSSIGAKLAAVANENKFPATYGSDVLTPFNYEFRVVEGDDINAFSVMGGYIYVYKGMVDFCESDDELAGIMAHEVIHAAHHHLVHLIDEQTKFGQQALVALLIGIAAAKGNANSIAGVATVSNLYQIAMTNGYSQDAERDADAGAFRLIQKTEYNPIGLLTPLERLAQKAELFDLGIYRSHPVTKERVYNMRKMLKDAGVPFDRYLVSGRIKSEIKDGSINDIKVKNLYLGDKYVFSFPVGENEGEATQRLQIIADRINSALMDNIEMFDIKCVNDTVTVKGKSVFAPTEEESGLCGWTPNECVKNMYNVL
ncbi:MAG: M48 family metalloprotease, partial [Armatimonadetes bacterium]|nr:M48 family metalloprotease [Candidatus Hippobium faecium]